MPRRAAANSASCGEILDGDQPGQGAELRDVEFLGARGRLDPGGAAHGLGVAAQRLQAAAQQ